MLQDLSSSKSVTATYKFLHVKINHHCLAILKVSKIICIYKGALQKLLSGFFSVKGGRGTPPFR